MVNGTVLQNGSGWLVFFEVQKAYMVWLSLIPPVLAICTAAAFLAGFWRSAHALEARISIQFQIGRVNR